MDGLRIGRSFRALRLRRGLRQSDVAERAGISRSQYGRIERGELRGVPIDDLVAVADALGADLDLRVRWHGENLDRLLDADHAALVNTLVRRLGPFGWIPAVEVTFSQFGERGAIDLAAWHPASRALLVVEVKTVVPDSQATLAAHDRKVRLAPAAVAERGWKASSVGKLLVIAEGATSRRRVAALEATFGAAYPDRGAAVNAWLRKPVGPMAGLAFMHVQPGAGGPRPTAGRVAVRRRRVLPDPIDARGAGPAARGDRRRADLHPLRARSDGA